MFFETIIIMYVSMVCVVTYTTVHTRRSQDSLVESLYVYSVDLTQVTSFAQRAFTHRGISLDLNLDSSLK